MKVALMRNWLAYMMSVLASTFCLLSVSASAGTSNVVSTGRIMVLGEVTENVREAFNSSNSCRQNKSISSQHRAGCAEIYEDLSVAYKGLIQLEKDSEMLTSINEKLQAQNENLLRDIRSSTNWIIGASITALIAALASLIKAVSEMRTDQLERQKLVLEINVLEGNCNS
jgi:hypothetical protein